MSEKNPEQEAFTFRDRRHQHNEEEETPAEETEEKEREPVAASGEAPGESGGAEAPPIDFPTFILSLASSAAYHMGGFQDPVSGKTSVNLDLAKQSIDILALLQEKTKGNLSKDEDDLLSHSLYDLRMKFVEMSKSS